MVPLIIRLCVKVVEANGMDTVGIYRIPGNTAAVNALKETLNSGFSNIDFTDSRWNDTRKLPSAHYQTLKYLMEHLRAVVEHSDVNKMETRNLALMFGPSIVRPSDDNMATMVTHMSDQCKIIETFITYCDWMFDDNITADDEVPPQIFTSNDSTTGSNVATGSAENDSNISTTSFNDMHNLIRRVNEAEAIALMDAQKSGKIKQILNVRRNSKREKRKKLRDHSIHAPSISSTQNICKVTRVMDSAANTSEHSVTGVYQHQKLRLVELQERDIDAEIASRQQQTLGKCTQQYAGTSSSADHSPSLGSSHDSTSHTVTSPFNLCEIKNESAGNVQNCTEADEMRRRRQKEIYSARRIFIAGTDADLDDTDADLDELVNHSRHLNLASLPTLDVLSAETREKIRRLQQLQGWASTALERRDIEMGMKTKHSLPQKVHGEKLSPPPPPQPSVTAPPVPAPQPPSSQSVSMKTTTAEEFSSTDALSLTSDYSTTSSAPLTIPVTISCIDHLAAASSDYASSDLSPYTRNASASPRHPDLEVTQLNFSTGISDHFKRSDQGMQSSTSEDCYSGSRDPEDAMLGIPLSCQYLFITETKRSESQPKLHRSHMTISESEMVDVMPIPAIQYCEKNPSIDGSKIKAHVKMSDRRELWRRHTLSDMDIIRQTLKEETKRKNSASTTSQTGNTHSNIGIKVNKFVEWMKNSSVVFVNDDTNESERVEIRDNSITCGTNKKPITMMTSSIIPKIVRSTDGSVSSSIGSNGDITSPSEVLPSSGDEQL
uniref:Rho-GAP domain-containing protein n=1 Tax=Wuchereria bancrofti TaxID=6293 RepID=A0A1I8EKK0_WUCBA